MANNTRLVYWVCRQHRKKDTKDVWKWMGFSIEVTDNMKVIPELINATGAQVVILDLDIDNRGHVDCEPLIWLRNEMGDSVKIVANTTFYPDAEEYWIIEKTADYCTFGSYNPMNFANVIRNL